MGRVTQWWSLGLSEALPPNAGSLAVVFASLDFSRLDRLVDSLTESRGEVIRVYRNDGALLYEYPLSAGFPRAPKTILWPKSSRPKNPTGVLGGDNLRAFRHIENLPAWVVIERTPSALSRPESWILDQLGWVCVLTLVILASAIVLVRLLGHLKTIRLALAELARVDPLTGLINRRAFLERCSLERSRVERQAGPLSLGLLDLDHFKEVNDRFGHQTGDQALRDFAKALIRTMRSTDALARTGGEEFAVLMPGTDEKSALEIAERIRAEVAMIALPQGRLTTSIGVALWDGPRVSRRGTAVPTKPCTGPNRRDETGSSPPSRPARNRGGFSRFSHAEYNRRSSKPFSLPNRRTMTHLLDLQILRPWLHDLGPWAPLVFIGLSMLQGVVFWIPGTPFEIAGGMVFGVWGGLFLSSVGIALGNLGGFWLARRLGKAWVDRWLSHHDLRGLGNLIRHPRLDLILAVIFFVPFLPKKIFCFLAGLSPVKTWRFLVATTVARVPSLLLTSWLGHAAIHGLGGLFWGVMIFGTLAGSLAFLYRKSPAGGHGQVALRRRRLQKRERFGHGIGEHFDT